jgi:hypothetical protein
MQPMTPMEAQQWIKDNIADPVPMDDKSKLHECLDALSSDDASISYKDFALKSLGVMSCKYGANIIVMCGALPMILKQLSEPILLPQAIRTLNFISKHGGDKLIRDDKVHIHIRNIVSNKLLPKYIQNDGMKLYYTILNIPLENSF